MIRENECLSHFCTLGIGGPARYLCVVQTVAQLQEALRWCRENEKKFIVLGKGSNCFFDDRGYNGLVIVNKVDFFNTPETGVFHVGAGYSFSLLGTQTARQGYTGLEFASGIPGTVGGAIYMNAGAHGNEAADTLVSVNYVTESGEIQVLKKEELEFAYRFSAFQTMQGAIIGATFKLLTSHEARTKQLDFITYRKSTQPYNDKSAGCIFRNPTSKSAGALIDQTGLKGTRVGDAMVSKVHANFLINKGKASAQDFWNLIKYVQSTVKEKTNIDLELEVKYIPYE